MTIRELIGQGLYYARRCKSLWVFGFVVGLASGGSSGGSSGGGGVGDGAGAVGGAVGGAIANGGAPFGLSAAGIVSIVVALIIVAVLAFIVRFISEGALIEGVVRVRQGGAMTTREGFRAGWAHWGVLLRIALIYVGTIIGSVALLVAPCVIAMRMVGPVGGFALGIPALIIAVPWLITLYLIQAFASRIAVLENRHAMDAIRKARLFLHGRLMHGLKLIVATFLGTLLLGLLSVAVILPAVLLLVALLPVISVVPAIAIGCLVLLPAVYVLVAMLGTLRSSIWTIGYVTQVEA